MQRTLLPVCGAQWACGWDGHCVQGGDEPPPGLPIIKGEVTGAGGGWERVKSLEDPWSVWRAATARHLAGCAEGRGQDLWVSGRHHMTVLGQGCLWKMQQVLSRRVSLPGTQDIKLLPAFLGQGLQAQTSPWARCLCLPGTQAGGLGAHRSRSPGLFSCSFPKLHLFCWFPGRPLRVVVWC